MATIEQGLHSWDLIFNNFKAYLKANVTITYIYQVKGLYKWITMQ